MIRLLWRFAIVVVIAILFTWLADHPGDVVIHWQGKEIKAQFIAAVAILLLGILLLLFSWNLVRKLWRSPVTAGQFLRERKNRKAWESLSKGIIAAGAGDGVAAGKHAAIAANSLADEPLVNVLAAQAAQLKGDHKAVKRIFEEMAKSPETEALGLRGLFAEARHGGDVAAAKAHAERALKLNPRLAWASTAVLQLQSAARDWQGAANTLQQQAKSGLLPSADANRKQAVVYAAQALAMEDSQKASARDLALRAHRLDPALLPATLVAARVSIAEGYPKKAVKLIHETWALAPHPDLAEVIAHAKPGDGPEPRFERVRDLVNGHAGGLEGAVALARAAGLAQRWDVARKALEPWVADQPQTRVCALMADIEEASGDKGRARQWLSRALRAPRDPMWVADGVASPRWLAISPVTGEITHCQWKPPFEAGASESILPAATPTVAIATTTPVSIEGTKPLEKLPVPDDPGIGDDVR